MNFGGVGVALVTPFNEKKEINFGEFEKVCQYVIDNGVDYLVVLGTTGESVVLSKKEKQDLIFDILLLMKLLPNLPHLTNQKS